MVIYPDMHIPEGESVLLVSYPDYEKMEELGWSMDKPESSEIIRENKIIFSSPLREDQ